MHRSIEEEKIVDTLKFEANEYHSADHDEGGRRRCFSRWEGW